MNKSSILLQLDKNVAIYTAPIQVIAVK